MNQILPQSHLHPAAAEHARAKVQQAGFPADEVHAWSGGCPAQVTDFAADRKRFAAFWRATATLLERLPPRGKRKPAEQGAAEQLLVTARDARERFLRAYVVLVYDALTGQRADFLRVDTLCERAALSYPGLVPDRATLALEMARPLREKDGHEIDQGAFLAHVLADPAAGEHLCHAMLLPREDSLARLAELERSGKIDLGAATLRREGRASIVTLTNPRFLNAEDEMTLDAAEIAVDLALLDPQTEICVNKIYRGLALRDVSPEETRGRTIEKPWIATVDSFAIGGHCQYLLVMDHIIAARDAYMTLPARKEGIIPGAANMRLPRFVGDRIARQAILLERRLDCDSPAGLLICDQVVAPEAMDAALGQAIANFTGSGAVSAAGNRRALRVVQEPLDSFRRYFAAYAREQAYCHLSPALIANLERHWNAHQRKI